MSTKGPFSHYPAEPETIASGGDELYAGGRRIQGVVADASARQLRAEVEQDGLSALFDLQRSALGKHGEELVGAAVLAGGTVRLFATSVRTYNKGIDQLNVEYAQRAATHFGVVRDADAKDPQAAADDFHVDVGIAKAALLAELKKREGELEDALDADAAKYARDLDRGPSDAALRRLVEAGALPLSAMGLVPGLDLSSLDMRTMLQNLRRNGELPAAVNIDQVVRALGGIDHLLSVEDFGINGNRDDLETMLRALRDLDGAEVDFVLLGLDDDELRHLDEMASSDDDSGWSPFDHNGLEHWDLLDFHHLFLANAGPGGLSRLRSQWRSINPEFSGVDGTQQVDDDGEPALEMPHWGDPGNWPLFDDDAYGSQDASSDDVDQGALGDCWMLAKTGALTHAPDSTWAESHIRENPNGTISVTMYDGDGDPHTVTVADDLPLDADGDPVFAGNDDSGGPSWNSYYEKAFALASQHGSDGEDGYGGTEGGWGQDDAMLMTGHEADELDTDYDDVRQQYESGHPIVVGTEGEGPDGNDAFVGHHEFYLKGYDDDGNMVLGNPWGSGEPDLVVGADEFEEYFNNAAALTS
ncbi:MAG: C2 family cysteine protease [Nocardioidaceae bacterium]